MAKANDWTKNLLKKQVATYSWDSDHAVSAHEGFTLQSGEEAPARPWVYVTADSYDFPQEFLEAIGEKDNLAVAITDGFVKMATNFGDTMQQNIQEPIWAWPRTTRRQSGEVVGSPRNIVDLGDLLQSYSVTFSE